MIQHRSTRSVNLRFVKKLHYLLSYVNASPELEQTCGLGWINDDEFRINKKILCELLDIRLNSLNVNLKKLQFNQTQSNREGWTCWKRNGFNRRDASLLAYNSGNDGENENFSSDNNLLYEQIKPSIYNISFKIGCFMKERHNSFVCTVVNLWHEIIQTENTVSISGTFYIPRQAQRIKLEKQPFCNAYEIVKSIICPPKSNLITFEHMFRFHSMFGPESTQMIKIQQLLDVSASNGYWLYFGYHYDELIKYVDVFACFDDKEPNCLILHSPEGQRKVWNLPDVDSNSDYLIDDQGMSVKDWSSYFKKYPLVKIDASV